MLDTKALIALGARAEIERLACQLGDLIQTFPELSTVAEDTIAATIAHATERRSRPPQLARASAEAAKVHAAAGNGTPPPTQKKTMSKATRAKLAASMRRRWAAAKKAGTTPTKKAHRKQQETPTP